MIAFQVDDMTCGHCVNAITRAVKSVDKNASVDIDLTAHSVTIDSQVADAAALESAIAETGYTPVRSPVGVIRAAAPPAAKRGSCCCG